MWPVGIPVLYSALLAQSAKAIRYHEPTTISRATRFLYSEYTLDFFWWEPMQLIPSHRSSFPLRVSSYSPTVAASYLKGRVCPFV